MPMNDELLSSLADIKRPGCLGVGKYEDGTEVPCGTADAVRCRLALCEPCFEAFLKHMPASSFA
jgi:hypothetical protein